MTLKNMFDIYIQYEILKKIIQDGDWHYNEVSLICPQLKHL